eukprot:scaffold14530_cov69-Phaeocystis_antarctica.AAC.1
MLAMRWISDRRQTCGANLLEAEVLAGAGEQGNMCTAARRRVRALRVRHVRARAGAAALI